MKAFFPKHDDNDASQVMLPPTSLKAQKGRGAVSNLQGRHEVHARSGFDDGWGAAGDAAGNTAGSSDTPAWKTEVTDEMARSILSRNTSPDLPFAIREVNFTRFGSSLSVE